jgi:hypothetical protein
MRRCSTSSCLFGDAESKNGDVCARRSLGHVLNNQDRQLVRVHPANANHLERPAPQWDAIARSPSQLGGLERRGVGGCPVEPLELEVFVIRSLLSGTGRPDEDSRPGPRPAPFAVGTSADLVGTASVGHQSPAGRNPPFPAGFNGRGAEIRTRDL